MNETTALRFGFFASALALWLLNSTPCCRGDNYSFTSTHKTLQSRSVTALQPRPQSSKHDTAEVARRFCTAIGQPISKISAITFPAPLLSSQSDFADPDDDDFAPYWKPRWLITFDGSAYMQVVDGSNLVCAYYNDSDMRSSSSSKATAIATTELRSLGVTDGKFESAVLTVVEPSRSISELSVHQPNRHESKLAWECYFYNPSGQGAGEYVYLWIDALNGSYLGGRELVLG